VFHVGDSRLYRLRGDRLEQLTTDHTIGPGQHIITRAIGAEADVRIDYVAVETERSDRFLLSTDGVHGGLNNLTLLKHLGRRASPQEAADAIVEAALDARIGDNATALVLDILDVPTMDYPAFAAEFTAEMSDVPQKPGITVDGFHLDEMLSDGRYTCVFRATDEVEARQVVMKFPKPLEGSDHPTREAFARESWIASRVQSPFVGQVLQVPPERQTQLYLALPFYDGETLAGLVRQTGCARATRSSSHAQTLRASGDPSLRAAWETSSPPAALPPHRSRERRAYSDHRSAARRDGSRRQSCQAFAEDRTSRQ
jgi:hypothetical protein